MKAHSVVDNWKAWLGVVLVVAVLSFIRMQFIQRPGDEPPSTEQQGQ